MVQEVGLPGGLDQRGYGASIGNLCETPGKPANVVVTGQAPPAGDRQGFRSRRLQEYACHR